MSYEKELEFAKKMAQNAGDIMKKYYRGDQHVEIKSDHTPVTVADKEVNHFLIEAVQREFSEHGVLGEEEGWRSDRDKLWVCDPIDGTPAFIFHIPTAMFSLAFVVDGVTKVAVTYNAFTNELYEAVEGLGAKRDGVLIHVSSRVWGEARLAGSSDGAVDGVAHRDDLAEKGNMVINSYGAVFKGCLVAEGSLDGRVFVHKSAHDIAAIKLIIEEAGGKVTDLQGSEQRYDRKINGAIMSNGLIHDELVNLVNQRS